MPDLNAEQFLSESPTAALKAQQSAVETAHILIPKVDNKDAYLTYLFEVWDD